MPAVQFNQIENVTDECCESVTVSSVFSCIPMILIGIASFAGNALVLGAIYRFKSLQTFSNAYIGSLAVTDVLASFTMPFSYTTVLLNGRWVFGNGFCKIQGFLLTFVCSAAMLTLLCFSMYRCYLVTTVQKRQSPTTVGRVVKVTVGMIWLLAFLYATPPLFGLGYVGYLPPYYSCLLDFSSSKSYSSFLIVLVFTTPLVVMVIAYIRIIKFIRLHNRTIMENTPQNRDRAQSDVHGQSSGRSQDEYSPTVMELKRKLDHLSTPQKRDRPLSDVHEQSSGPSQDENGPTVMELKKELDHLSTPQKRDRPLSDVHERSPGPSQDENCPAVEEPEREQDGAQSELHGGQSSSPSEFTRKRGNFFEEENTDDEEEGKRTLERLDESDGEVMEMQRIEACRSFILESDYVSGNVKSYSPQKIRFLEGGKSLTGGTSRGRFAGNSVNAMLTRWKTKVQNRQKILRQYRKRVTKQARLARILFITIAVFLICWTPLAMDSFLRGIGHTEERPKNFQLTAIWLAYTSAICNPIIYALLNSRFKSAFKTILNELAAYTPICNR